MEWALENENHPTKVQSDVIDLSHIQKHLDGTVRISFDDSRFRSPLMIKDIFNQVILDQVIQNQLNRSQTFQ